MAGPFYTVRPIETWPGKRTPHRSRSPFKTSWSHVLHVLERELKHLRARDVVLRLAVRDAHLRNDGQLRADARPAEPGVILEFLSTAKGIRFRFATDRYGFWQDNVDAISRSLEALRMIDRYGVTSGEQYEGFRALPSQGTTTITTEDAKEMIRRYAPSANGDWAVAALVARSASHPDRGGSDEAFVNVTAAIQTLKAAGIIT
jgi:hypothetical protein